ncbi:MAG TPA: nucleotide pyrophosphohydrolase [Candidatus Latescibacteria bacterium]|nr:nucleotide pyrophosphohydrolase [Candidatus Latescibacterota bacterium]
MELNEFQDLMRRTYYQRDKERGLAETFVWFTEEVGELAKLLRRGERSTYAEEIGDVLAWLASLANLMGVGLEAGIEKYRNGCPRCGAMPCTCPQYP